MRAPHLGQAGHARSVGGILVDVAIFTSQADQSQLAIMYNFDCYTMTGCGKREEQNSRMSKADVGEPLSLRFSLD